MKHKLQTTIYQRRFNSFCILDEWHCCRFVLNEEGLAAELTWPPELLYLFRCLMNSDLEVFPTAINDALPLANLEQCTTKSAAAFSGQRARHPDAYLVLGARPWGTTGLRQGMDMMLMLRYRPWLVVQDACASAIDERKKVWVEEIL